jgi:hypothetical protein
MAPRATTLLRIAGKDNPIQAGVSGLKLLGEATEQLLKRKLACLPRKACQLCLAIITIVGRTNQRNVHVRNMKERRRNAHGQP